MTSAEDVTRQISGARFLPTRIREGYASRRVPSVIVEQRGWWTRLFGR